MSVTIPVIGVDALEDIRLKAYKRALGKKYEQYYFDLLSTEEGIDHAAKKFNEPMAAAFNEDKQLKKDMIGIFQSKKEKLDNLKSTHVFITVNPKSEVTLKLLCEKISKFLKKKWLTGTEVMYTVEQRGEDEAHMGQGIHAHILVVRGTEPNKVRRETKNTFKDLCDVENSGCLNFKFVEDKGVDNMRSYIKGDKKCKDSVKQKSKELKMAIDKVFREKNNLEQYYVLQK